MSHTVLLVVGYGVTWLAIALYLLNIRKREGRAGLRSQTDR